MGRWGMLHGRVAQAATTVMLAVALTHLIAVFESAYGESLSPARCAPHPTAPGGKGRMGGVSVSSLRHIPTHETLFRRVGCLMTGRRRLDLILKIILETIAANPRCADLSRLKKPSQRRL